jgi:dipeptidyl aminopeptidase/acylaminoacyl peptidase
MISRRRFETVAGIALLGLAAAITALSLLGKPTPLAVVAATPRDGAADVRVGSHVAITFSRPIEQGSVRAALSVAPPTDGLVSAAGRRAVFTPTGGFRADSEYAVTVGTGVHDRAGRSLGKPVVVRFRTGAQRLVVRTGDGRLLRTTLSGAIEPLAGPGVGEFAVSEAGDVAYVLPADGALIVQPAGSRPARRIGLPRKPSRFGAGGEAVDIRELQWTPDGSAIGFLGAAGDGASVVYLARLAGATPTPEALSQPPDVAPRSAQPMPDALRDALAGIVYGRDSFAFTPDARGAILRERNWEYIVEGFDGQLRGVFGPFLAVGNASRRGEMVAFVELDPADRGSRRRVVAYERAGRLRAVSPPDRDSHSPRFAHLSRSVVFLAALAGRSSLPARYAVEIADLDTDLRRRLTLPGPGETDDSPRWSPDDAWISFRRVLMDSPERAGVWLVPATGGEAHRLPVAGMDARWSP